MSLGRKVLLEFGSVVGMQRLALLNAILATLWRRGHICKLFSKMGELFAAAVTRFRSGQPVQYYSLIVNANKNGDLADDKCNADILQLVGNLVEMSLFEGRR